MTDDRVEVASTFLPEIAATDGALAHRRAAPTIGLTKEFATNVADNSFRVVAAAFAPALEPASRPQPRID